MKELAWNLFQFNISFKEMERNRNTTRKPTTLGRALIDLFTYVSLNLFNKLYHGCTDNDLICYISGSQQDGNMPAQSPAIVPRRQSDWTSYKPVFPRHEQSGRITTILHLHGVSLCRSRRSNNFARCYNHSSVNHPCLASVANLLFLFQSLFHFSY